MRLPFRSALLVALILPAACAAPPPPPPPAGPVLPVPPAESAIPARAKVPAGWHFTAEADTCTALAAGNGASLRIVLRRSQFASFVLSAPAPKTAGAATKEPAESAPAAPAPEPGALRFAGRDGGWTAPARIGPGPVAGAYVKLDAGAIGRVALLLGGGTLDPIGGPEGLPALLLPPAGAAGRSWYGCARGLLF
ncbi:MAG: hypothetical protein KGI51_11225 [Rhodospirillales bacterium]|nr:hypothetical protein [Rhodospirillales bacterium]